MTAVTIGSKIRKMCSRCNAPKPQAGGAMQFVLGVKRWICLDCNAKGRRACDVASLAQREDS